MAYMSFAELCYEMIFIDQLVVHTHIHLRKPPPTFTHIHAYI